MQEANENFRRVALILAKGACPGSARPFVLTAADRGEGTTTVTLNVARHLKEGCGVTPLVVEMNLGRPVLADMFGLDATHGVEAIASGRHAPAECVQHGAFGLAMIPGGPTPSQHGFGSDLCGTARRIVTDLAASHEVILFDAPPILRSADALALAAVVLNVLLVVEAGRTRTEMLDRTRDEIERVSGVQLVGVVLNKHKRLIPAWLYRTFVR